MSLLAFAAEFDENFDLVARGLLLSAALLAQDDLKLLSATPGVALLSVEALPEGDRPYGRLVLAVLVDADRTGRLEAGRIVLLPQLSGPFNLVAAALGRAPKWLYEVWALGVKEPTLQLSCGDAVTAHLQGVAGVPLSWPGSSGFATAGHVGAAAGTAVHDATGHIGQVVWANDPTNHGLAREADFAVVELAPGHACASSFGPAAGAGPNADIFIGGVSGPSSKVLGYNHFWYIANLNATLGDAYLTAGQITNQGDSGAAVTLRSGEVIGHVVGASPGVTTIIQDLDFQLDAARPTIPGLAY
jgi:hypothetical protein